MGVVGEGHRPEFSVFPAFPEPLFPLVHRPEFSVFPAFPESLFSTRLSDSSSHSAENVTRDSDSQR